MVLTPDMNLVQDTPFAKVAHTADGKALMIGSAIILITAIGLSVTGLLAIAGGYEHALQVQR